MKMVQFFHAKNKVLEIEPPRTQKEIRKFIDVVNYFRDHIKNQSILIKPLYAMIHATKKVNWNMKGITAFNEIKQAINNLPTLFWIVYLHTDASDHGIGGYLFQLVDGQERHAVFMSKLFTK